MATNILFKTSDGKNPMRLILGLPGDKCREEYDRLLDDALKSDIEPIVIVRDCEPRVWIDDDIVFILGNIADSYDHDDWPDGFDEWWRRIESKDRHAGETFVFSRDGFEVIATVDDTPMTGLRTLREEEV